MLRTDYILRLVEQVQRAMAAIAACRQAGDLEGAARLLDEASAATLGLGFSVIVLQPVPALQRLFTSEGELDPGRCVAAGELLVQAAALHSAHGRPDQACDLRQRSLELFLAGYRVLPARERALYARKALDLLTQLPDAELDDPQQLELVRACEAAGRYDRAEDLLFPLVDDGVAGALDLGLALYAGLLAKKDEDLVAGGLPRDEVQQGLRELQRRR